jgi:predicted acetyltransferase
MEKTTTLALEEADPAYAAAYLDMAKEYLLSDVLAHERNMFQSAVDDLDGHIRRLMDQSLGRGLDAGMVPQTTFWLLDGGVVVGTSRLRHELTPQMLRESGHIGYGIRPSRRGMGYGNEICRLTLGRARQLGMQRVLLTCKDTNIPSARIIENNGGVLENKVVSRETGAIMRRYWIDLR